MSTAAHRRAEPRIRTVQVTDHMIVVELHDGRSVSVPLWWSWRLERATPEQRRRFEILDDGESVRWPDIDEDLSARGFLEGSPAPRPTRQR
jgi:Protein of unknown function (DUF2442)